VLRDGTRIIFCAWEGGGAAWVSSDFGPMHLLCCRWLAERLGGKPTTMSGLSGLGDIMLTCYGSLSRNRLVGVRLGRGERLQDILASSTQVRAGWAGGSLCCSLGIVDVADLDCGIVWLPSEQDVCMLCVLQVAEGVGTAGAVVALARKYRVSLPGIGCHACVDSSSSGS
jgi:hypothetical protein